MQDRTGNSERLRSPDLITNCYYKLHYGAHLNPYHNVERDGPIAIKKKKTGKAPKFPRCVPEIVIKPPTKPVGSAEMYERMLSKSYRIRKVKASRGILRWPETDVKPRKSEQDEFQDWEDESASPTPLTSPPKSSKIRRKEKPKSVLDDFELDFSEEEATLKLRAALLVMSLQRPPSSLRRRPCTTQEQTRHSQKFEDVKVVKENYGDDFTEDVPVEKKQKEEVLPTIPARPRTAEQLSVNINRILKVKRKEEVTEFVEKVEKVPKMDLGAGRPNPFGGAEGLAALQGARQGLKKVEKKEPTAEELLMKKCEEEHEKQQDMARRNNEMDKFRNILEEFIPSNRQFSTMNGVVEKEWNEVLGTGKFATVYKAKAKIANKGGDVVLKIAEFRGNNPHKAGTLRQHEQMKLRANPPAKIVEEYGREIRCLSLLQHTNIIRLEGVFVPPAPLGLAIEYMSGGSLGHALKDDRWNPSQISQQQRFGILKDILRGLTFMHSKEYVHRDIKPFNILLCRSLQHSDAPVSPRPQRAKDPADADRDGSSHWVSAKIADFGTAVHLKKNSTLQSEVGTSGYTAPEVFMGAYDSKVDVFSFSVVMWVLFATDQNNPMVGQSDEIVRSGSIRPVLGPEHPSAVSVICKKGWASEPSSRPSLPSICNLLNVK